MPEQKIVSPLLDDLLIGNPTVTHDGISCSPAIKGSFDNRFIVKCIRVPQSQSLVDAMLITGALQDAAAANGYFQERADAICQEAELLRILARDEGFLSFEGCQYIPIGGDLPGYEVYLLSRYRLSLDRYMRRKGITHLEAVNLGIDLCAAMAACRRNGLMYIDLKPGNIYITPRKEYKIGDLGFAALNSLKFSSMPAKYRSPYTAPELLDDMAVLNKTVDTYAIGMLLYQIFNNGQLPSDPKNLPAPANGNEAINAILLKACALDPSERYADPTELWNALIAYLQSNTINNTQLMPSLARPKAASTRKNPQSRIPKRVKPTPPPEPVPEPAQVETKNPEPESPEKAEPAEINLEEILKELTSYAAEPEEAKPTEAEPEETKLTEAEPEETKLTEAEPEETKPTEAEPEETKLTEAEPEETKPTEAEPEEAKLTEAEPEETKPDEAKPTETEPKEAKSDETKPDETAPEEGAQGEEAELEDIWDEDDFANEWSFSPFEEFVPIGKLTFDPFPGKKPETEGFVALSVDLPKDDIDQFLPLRIPADDTFIPLPEKRPEDENLDPISMELPKDDGNTLLPIRISADDTFLVRPVEVPAVESAEPVSEEKPAEAASEPVPEEVPVVIPSEPAPAEVPAEAASEPVPEEVPVEVTPEPVSEEAPVEVTPAPVPEEKPADKPSKPAPRRKPASGKSKSRSKKKTSQKKTSTKAELEKVDQLLSTSNASKPKPISKDAAAPVAAPVVRKERKKGKPLGLQKSVAALLLLGGISFGGWTYYNNYYLQNVDALTIEGTDSQLTVTVHSDIPDRMLSIACVDAYGSSERENVHAGQASFHDLKPGSLYKIQVEVNGMHQLTGQTSGIFTTEAVTNVVGFTAAAGDRDGDLILNLAVEGHEPSQWTLTYSSKNTKAESITFSGYNISVSGLTLGETYHFELSCADGSPLTGQSTLDVPITGMIAAQNLRVTDLTDGTMKVVWDSFGEGEASGWRARCYNDSGYDEILEVSDSSAVFSGIDPTHAYTVEVTAAGMTKPTSIAIAANPVTIKNFQVDSSDPKALTLSWECAGAADQNLEWLLTYSIDGTPTSDLVRCDGTTAVITPRIPNAVYEFTLLASEDASLFNNVVEYKCPDVDRFVGHAVSSHVMTSQLLPTPNPGWTYFGTPNSMFTDQFEPGQRISMVLKVAANFYLDDEPVELLYVVRDQEGKVIPDLTLNLTANWAHLWAKEDYHYAELDTVKAPTIPGEYTLELYFDGGFVTSTPFTVS